MPQHPSYIASPVNVQEAALVTPRVKCKTLCSTDHDEGLPISCVEDHRSDREGSLIINCRESKAQRNGVSNNDEQDVPSPSNNQSASTAYTTEQKKHTFSTTVQLLHKPLLRGQTLRGRQVAADR